MRVDLRFVTKNEYKAQEFRSLFLDTGYEVIQTVMSIEEMQTEDNGGPVHRGGGVTQPQPERFASHASASERCNPRDVAVQRVGLNGAVRQKALACCMQRRSTSITQAVVFPEPTGPAQMRPNASDFINRARVGGAVYSIAIGSRDRLQCYRFRCVVGVDFDAFIVLFDIGPQIDGDYEPLGVVGHGLLGVADAGVTGEKFPALDGGAERFLLVEHAAAEHGKRFLNGGG